MAAKRRPTSGESAACRKKKIISCRSGAYLVFAFRSFLMKADFGEAGLISLILGRQQQQLVRKHGRKNGFQAYPYRSA
jgi:hypothetical protein